MMYRGEAYTVKVKSARLFNLVSESAIKDRAALLFGERATVTSVERPAFTQYYLFHFTLKENATEKAIANTIRETMNAEGFDNAEVFSITRGNESTNILEEVAKETAAGVAPVLAPAGSFMLKAGLVLALALLGYGYLISRRNSN